MRLTERYGIEDGHPMSGKPQPTGDPHDPNARDWVSKHLPDGGVLPVVDSASSLGKAVRQPRTQKEAFAAALAHCWFATRDPQGSALVRSVQQQRRALEKQREAMAATLDHEDAKSWVATVDDGVKRAGRATFEYVTLLADQAALVLPAYDEAIEQLQCFERSIKGRMSSWAGLPSGPHRGENTLLTLVTQLCYVAGLDVPAIAESIDDQGDDEGRERRVRRRLGRLEDWKGRRLRE